MAVPWSLYFSINLSVIITSPQNQTTWLSAPFLCGRKGAAIYYEDVLLKRGILNNETEKGIISKRYEIDHVLFSYKSKLFVGEYLDFATLPQKKICIFVSSIFWNVYILCLYHFYFIFLSQKVNFNRSSKSKKKKTKQNSI